VLARPQWGAGATRPGERAGAASLRPRPAPRGFLGRPSESFVPGAGEHVFAMAHPAYLREKARSMRLKRGYTIDELAERLALSRSTIYYWVRDLPIPHSGGRAGWPESARRKLSRLRLPVHRGGLQARPQFGIDRQLG
jgi:predicted DNA-binding transcriptional regulator AlpA